MDLPKHQPTHRSIQQSALGCCHYVPLFLSSGHKSSPRGVRVQPLPLFRHGLHVGGMGWGGGGRQSAMLQSWCHSRRRWVPVITITNVLPATWRLLCCRRSAWWLLCQHSIITLHCVVGFWWPLCTYAFWILWQIRGHWCPAQKQPRSRNIYKKHSRGLVK